MNLARCLAVAAVAVMVGGTLPGPRGAAARGTACIAYLPYAGQCYYPDQVARAEATLRFHAVRPTAEVSRASTLQLEGIVVGPIAGPNQTTLGRGRIVYVYGKLPPRVFDIRITPRRHPKFAVVTETLGNDNFANQLTLGRPYTAKWHAYGPWWFVAVGRIPHVALWVLSNLTRTQVREIGQGILAAASAGK